MVYSLKPYPAALPSLSLSLSLSLSPSLPPLSLSLPPSSLSPSPSLSLHLAVPSYCGSNDNDLTCRDLSLQLRHTKQRHNEQRQCHTPHCRTPTADSTATKPQFRQRHDKIRLPSPRHPNFSRHLRHAILRNSSHNWSDSDNSHYSNTTGPR